MLMGKNRFLIYLNVSYFILQKLKNHTHKKSFKLLNELDYFFVQSLLKQLTSYLQMFLEFYILSEIPKTLQPYTQRRLCF